MLQYFGNLLYKYNLYLFTHSYLQSCYLSLFFFLSYEDRVFSVLVPGLGFSSYYYLMHLIISILNLNDINAMQALNT